MKFARLFDKIKELIRRERELLRQEREERLRKQREFEEKYCKNCKSHDCWWLYGCCPKGD